MRGKRFNNVEMLKDNRERNSMTQDQQDVLNELGEFAGLWRVFNQPEEIEIESSIDGYTVN